MRWELNDLARRLDRHEPVMEFKEALVASPDSGHSQLSPNALRMLAAIEGLPEEEREVFSLVRIQGMSHVEAAEVLGVATKTVQRRLNRSLVLLAGKVGDLSPDPAPQE
ncbi:MAG: sigma-70 family RNA polymerase sigma factor [Pirellulales bacterium]